MWSTHNIPVEFQTLTELSDSASLDQNKNLILSFSGAIKRVSVAYYRAGYAPTDYFSDKEWLSRETIEFSNAIKCPTVGLQLAGTKIIQAALCQEKLIEKYLPNSDSKLISNVFASQYNFGPSQTTAESTAALESAIADGSKWVLKPQREGGGNNLYGKELSEFASKHRNDGVLNGKLSILT